PKTVHSFHWPTIFMPFTARKIADMFYPQQVLPKASIPALVKEVLLYSQTDLEKIRAIWIWICHHIEYDVKGYHSKDLKGKTPEEALMTGKAVCSGYSGLFCEMCSIAGIKCTAIGGYSKGYNYEIGKTFKGDPDHDWNAVYLEGKWHLLDTTWGAGHVNENCSKFTFKYVEFYFFTHPTLFINNHFPMDENWQLISPRISIKAFENMVFRTGEFFNIGLTYIHPDVQVVNTVNGRAIINMGGNSPTLFMYNLDGRKDCALINLTTYGMKLEVLPPKVGEYKLKIYAKLLNTDEKMYSFICAYMIKCNEVDDSFKMPKAVHNPLGPSWYTEIKGIIEPSHPEPLIYCSDGQCSIKFFLDKELSFTSKLTCDELDIPDDVMRNHVFKTQKDNSVEFKIQLPSSGLYVFTIFSKEKSSRSSTFSHLCEYLISCTNEDVHLATFPKVYTSWTEECELFEPLSGILPPNTVVAFKFKIPHVKKVQVYGKEGCPLTLSSDGYWEGTCNTLDAKNLNIGPQSDQHDQY
uniref:Kyphoscoliosis peptidase n=1 Tax=Callorhinchus milii TaxID=7868 RepID=A0A4W3IHQ0_CALMI